MVKRETSSVLEWMMVRFNFNKIKTGISGGRADFGSLSAKVKVSMKLLDTATVKFNFNKIKYSGMQATLHTFE